MLTLTRLLGDFLGTDIKIAQFTYESLRPRYCFPQGDLLNEEVLSQTKGIPDSARTIWTWAPLRYCLLDYIFVLLLRSCRLYTLRHGDVHTFCQ